MAWSHPEEMPKRILKGVILGKGKEVGRGQIWMYRHDSRIGRNDFWGLITIK